MGDGEDADEAARRAYYQQDARAVAAAQRESILAKEPDAAHLLFLVLALAGADGEAPERGRRLLGGPLRSVRP